MQLYFAAGIYCLHGKLTAVWNFTSVKLTEVSFTTPEVMWTLIMKLPHTKVKFYPEVKSQTGLSSLWVSCKRALRLNSKRQLVFAKGSRISQAFSTKKGWKTITFHERHFHNFWRNVIRILNRWVNVLFSLCLLVLSFCCQYWIGQNRKLKSLWKGHVHKYETKLCISRNFKKKLFVNNFCVPEL